MTLKKLHKNSGFKVPKDYFSQVEEDILNDVRLKAKAKDSGFGIPESYFDEMETAILSHVKPDSKVITLKSKSAWYYIAGIAASIVLIFSIFNHQSSTTEISVEMVETHLENSDLDTYELAQLLTDADLLEEDFVIVDATYDEANLETYLLNNADIEILLE
ncbi:MAG: hypothetical protein GYB35_06440 [Algicola sp.]|nr:hypothetical protein [Algicola sp.]